MANSQSKTAANGKAQPKAAKVQSVKVDLGAWGKGTFVEATHTLTLKRPGSKHAKYVGVKGITVTYMRVSKNLDAFFARNIKRFAVAA